MHKFMEVGLAMKCLKGSAFSWAYAKKNISPITRHLQIYLNKDIGETIRTDNYFMKLNMDITKPDPF